MADSISRTLERRYRSTSLSAIDLILQRIVATIVRL